MTDRPQPSRAAVVATARRWIGTPYLHRASLEGVGCDCLGLVRGVWREFWGEEPEALPAYAPDWAEAGRVETLIAAGRRHLVAIPVDRARPGDVVLFRWRPELPAKHAGILVAPDRFVHAYDGAAVVESPLGPWWRRRLAAAFAFPGVVDFDDAPANVSVVDFDDAPANVSVVDFDDAPANVSVVDFDDASAKSPVVADDASPRTE